MPTKISGVDATQIASIGAGRAVSRPADSSGGASQGANEASAQNVQITGTARHLAQLEQTLRDLPMVDETRVANIRTAIEQGTYTVQPQHIAAQLIALERSLRSVPDPIESEPSGEPGSSGK